jgi:hypothetical protein
MKRSWVSQPCGFQGADFDFPQSQFHAYLAAFACSIFRNLRIAAPFAQKNLSIVLDMRTREEQDDVEVSPV